MSYNPRMEHGMILSASGWRKVFASSGDENDTTVEIGRENTLLAALAAESFAEYITAKTSIDNPVVVCGCDARPTGAAITDAVLCALVTKKIIVRYVGIIAAPEIMAYAKRFDGFVYITASHNPIGHNGIKFGLSDGGVLEASENKKIIATFTEKCADENAEKNAMTLISRANKNDIEILYATEKDAKQKALAAYKSFLAETITATSDRTTQEKIFSKIKENSYIRKIGVVCDFNGSARAVSVDKEFFAENDILFHAINDTAGKIAHGIIPEGKNLEVCADEMRRLQKEGHKEFVLGYMPDCDGDRGNIVYWDEKKNDAVVMAAQEVFSLSVLGELLYSAWLQRTSNNTVGYKAAVCANCPTSMRIEKIADTLGARVFRAEVGEANVVNLARQKRNEGYNVRILGEGSNGGTITYPASVRDPLNTIFVFIKLLAIKDLYKSWCEKCGAVFSEGFSIADIFATLPVYTTTPTSESRAIIHLKTSDQTALKKSFQKIFESEWAKDGSPAKKFSFERYEIVLTNGTTETRNASDMSASGTGGLKILFYEKDESAPCAFMWMRGSQTEPLFRVMCDVAGNDNEMEQELVEWERKMITEADNS